MDTNIQAHRKWQVYVTNDGAISLEPGSTGERKPIIVYEQMDSKPKKLFDLFCQTTAKTFRK
jgi:hypothetical protein